MAKKKGDEKVNQTPQSDNDEQNFDEEPNFDDPEGFVDDIPDEELLADVLESKPKESDGYENVVVVDGCPQVGPERLEKLQSVITKIFSKFGKIVNEYYPTTETGVTTGYIFLEYNNPQFFRESTLRRSLIPNIPLFCETRWSAKYKSIRIFSDNFLVIVQALEKLTDDSGNKNTKIKAHLLLTAATTSTYILTLLVIATYSAKLEPVCNQLQQVNMNIKDVNAHVIKLTDLLQSHRDNACEEFSVIFKKAQSICQDLNVELKQSRLTARQAHRSNFPSANAEEYFRRSIFIPYLDSIISSLRTRFSCTQGKAFSLLQLHPQDMNKLDKVSFLNVVQNINNLYGDILPNFTAEATTWYEMWKNKEITNKIPNCMTLIDEATTFYPAVSEALKIGMTLPATTCSIERSFSTLRRVKIWNRSTMSDERLSGLCMLSVHKKRVNDCPKFIDKVVDKFGQQERRVALLF